MNMDVIIWTMPSGYFWSTADGGAGGRAECPPGLARQIPQERREALLVIPGEMCQARLLRFPTKSRRQAQTAAPYLMEDDIAAPLEGQHVAVGPLEGDSDRLAVVVNRDSFSKTLAPLPEAGIAVVRTVPDFMLLRPPPGQAVLYDLGERAIFAFPDGTGWAGERELASIVLEDSSLWEGIQAVTVHAADHAFWAGPLAAHGLDVARQPQPDYEKLMAVAREALAGEDGINLQQGVFSPGGRWQHGWGRYARAAALFLGVLLAGLALILASGWQMQNQARAVEARAIGELNATLPQAGGADDPRTFLLRALAEGRAETDDFLRHYAALARALEAIPSVEALAIRYDRGQGGLNVTLSYPSFAELEQMKAALSANGFTVSEGPARQTAGRVEGDLEVRLP